MKAARLHAPRDVRIEEMPTPQPGPGQVLMRVTAVGICRSDIQYYASGRIGVDIMDEPQALGHEFAGQVVGVGPNVTDFVVGDRVAADPAVSCGACEQCELGNPNLCLNMRFTGGPGQEGALREYMSYPANHLYRLPTDMSDAEGVLLEPLGIAIHAHDLGHMHVSSTAVVVGCGPIGLSVIEVLRAGGAQEVYACDLLADRLAQAEKRGALPLSLDGPLADLMRSTEGRGVDAGFEAAGSLEAPQVTAEMVRNGGRLVLIGIPPGNKLTLQADCARRKGLSIYLVRRMKHTYPRAIALVHRGLVQVEWMVTHRFPLRCAPQAFELVEGYADRVLKAIVEL